MNANVNDGSFKVIYRTHVDINFFKYKNNYNLLVSPNDPRIYEGIEACINVPTYNHI